MDALLRQPLDHLLAELAQRDAVARQLGMLLDQPSDVAAGRVGVHAQQQVRRGEMEEAERVRLHDLRAVQQLAQLRGRRRECARP